MSLAAPPVPDALGNSKGLMSHDLEVSLHCHCNSRTVSGWDIFLRMGNFQKIELGFRIETERVSKDLYRLLLNDRCIYPVFFLNPFFQLSAMTPTHKWNRGESQIEPWFRIFPFFSIDRSLHFDYFDFLAILAHGMDQSKFLPGNFKVVLCLTRNELNPKWCCQFASIQSTSSKESKK
jgi:hypothetical protein